MVKMVLESRSTLEHCTKPWCMPHVWPHLRLDCVMLLDECWPWISTACVAVSLELKAGMVIFLGMLVLDAADSGKSCETDGLRKRSQLKNPKPRKTCQWIIWWIETPPTTPGCKVWDDTSLKTLCLGVFDRNSARFSGTEKPKPEAKPQPSTVFGVIQ
jgi:hypothetical protein